MKTAYGAGGQMIFVIPEFDMVVVFTAEKADKRRAHSDRAEEPSSAANAECAHP